MTADYFSQYRDASTLLGNTQQDLRLCQSALHCEVVRREEAEAEVKRLRGRIDAIGDERDACRSIISTIADHANGYWNGGVFNGDRAEEVLRAIADALGEPF